MLTKSLRILILLSYYQRPLLVRNALNSILKANKYHQNWELVFGDDGSTIPGQPIVEEILKDHLEQVTFINSRLTFEEKSKQGLVLGKYANEVIDHSNADVGIMLCDDDELHPLYLKNLSEYFTNHGEALHCYSKIHLYNPLFQKSEDVDGLMSKFNQWSGKINPVSKVDASQVAWRLICCKHYNAWFAESTNFVEHMPWAKDTDGGFFKNLYEKCGECWPTEFVSQYKGIHDYQLVWHKKTCANGLKHYNDMIEELAGVIF